MDVTETYQENLATGWSKVYNVPVGTITLKKLIISTQEKSTSSFKVAIYWDQNSNGKNMIKIAQVYTKNKSYDIDLGNAQFISNGNSRIVTRRHVFGSLGARETFVRWIANLS